MPVAYESAAERRKAQAYARKRAAAEKRRREEALRKFQIAAAAQHARAASGPKGIPGKPGRPPASEMPNAGYRTPEAVAFRNALPQTSIGSAISQVAQTFAAPVVGRSLASWIPGGIPHYTDPLDIGLGVGSWLPLGAAGHLAMVPLGLAGRGTFAAAREGASGIGAVRTLLRPAPAIRWLEVAGEAGKTLRVPIPAAGCESAPSW